MLSFAGDGRGIVPSGPGDVEHVADMDARRLHDVEKLQVQVAAAVGLAAAYFLLWPVVAPTPPTEAMAMLATGSYLTLAKVVAVVAGLAVVAAVLTVSCRPQGALAVALLAAGAFSLRCRPLREVLWVRQDDLPRLFWQMLAEAVLLAAVAAAAAGLVGIVRRVLALVAGKWLWRDPLLSLPEDQRRSWLDGLPQSPWGGGFRRIFVEGLGVESARRGGARLPSAEALTRWALCSLLTIAISLALVAVLLRSADRGQILFAILAGCFLGSLLAYQIVPTRLGLPAWAGPVVAAAALYVLSAVSTVAAGQGAWMQVKAYSQILPIDWATAGLGGSLLGYWVSSRMQEARFLEQSERRDEEEGA